MKTIKQKEIKNLVKLGAAVDITAEEGSLTRYRRLDPIAVSRGKYGMNGGLLKDNQTGELYAITARSSAWIKTAFIIPFWKIWNISARRN